MTGPPVVALVVAEVVGPPSVVAPPTPTVLVTVPMLVLVPVVTPPSGPTPVVPLVVLPLVGVPPLVTVPPLVGVPPVVGIPVVGPAAVMVSVGVSSISWVDVVLQAAKARPAKTVTWEAARSLVLLVIGAIVVAKDRGGAKRAMVRDQYPRCVFPILRNFILFVRKRFRNFRTKRYESRFPLTLSAGQRESSSDAALTLAGVAVGAAVVGGPRCALT